MDDANLIEPFKMIQEAVIRMEEKLAESRKIHWAESSLHKTEAANSDAMSVFADARPEHVFALQEEISEEYIDKITEEFIIEAHQLQNTRWRREIWNVLQTSH